MPDAAALLHRQRGFLYAFEDGAEVVADFENTSYLTGYMQGMILEGILKQCGDDLSRKNIVKQAKSLSHVVLPTAFPGIEVNTSEASNMIWSQMQLQRWGGGSWEPFGGILDASSE